MNKQDLLIEIGTEELPPKALLTLSHALESGFQQALDKAGLAYGNIQRFATPRRLGLLVSALATHQADSQIEKFGPAVNAAFDEAGKPTKAAEGFARSCGVTVDDLEQKSDGKLTKLYYQASRPGEATQTLVGPLLEAALAALPIPRRMRWGSSRAEFIRPVHWLVLLFGDEVIESEIFGILAGRETWGHRFHWPQALPIDKPANYAELLAKQGWVLANFDERREQIRAQLLTAASEQQAEIVIDDALLDEVTALVEWPVALTGSFDEGYLELPQEALVSSMQGHQKYFHLLDDAGQILPRFITISNIESRDPAQVIAGNERVIGPRLADAAFFYEQDRKISLADRCDRLDSVIFQQSLGSLGDKTRRVADLAAYIAARLDVDTTQVRRAAELARCDLLTSMVNEFPELQGIMGEYYAQADAEPEAVSIALREQYLPRFSGDALPASITGIILALAERLDTIAGLFSINQPPTGSKDPFALRRAALGILRILVEKRVELDLPACIEQACRQQPGEFDHTAISAATVDFIYERFRAWYQDRQIGTDIFQAVDALRPASPYDFDQRVHAVAHFCELPQAASLAAANKRVSNILGEDTDSLADFDRALFTEDAETALADALKARWVNFEEHFQQRDYSNALGTLATLQEPVDTFFDQVMVNSDDEALRCNRQALLQALRTLFLRIADISLLQNSLS